MNILIVDDESFFRVSFMTVIDWELHGCNIVGDASDGIEAIQLIEEHKPDIVFLDISMPKMNGLEVIEKLNVFEEKPVVIMLSSYTDFEYVRHAMKLGAFDYIHKPSLNEKVMLDILNKVKDKLNKDRVKNKEYTDLRQKAEKSDVILKREHMELMLTGGITDKLEYKIKTKELGIRIKSSNIYIFAITIDDIELVKKRYSKEKSHIINTAFDNITREVLEEEEMEYLQYSDNLYVVVKSFSKVNSLYDIKRYIQAEIATKLKESLKQLLNISVTIGISNRKNSLHDLPLALHEAIEAVESRFSIGKGNIIEYNKFIVKNSDENREKTEYLLNNMKDSINCKEWERTKSYAIDFYKMWLESKNPDRALVLKNYKLIYYMLREKYNEIKKFNPHLKYDFLQIESIINAEYLEELHEKIGRLIDDLNHIISELQIVNIKSSKVRTLIKYINTHFNDDLSLDILAEKLDLNSSYLSRLFKKETGITLVQYINQVRIEKAINYLKTTDKKNYEIADCVGFQSVEYFNAIFKKITNKSPSEIKG